MLELEVTETRYYPTEDGARRIEKLPVRREYFRSMDDLAGWLILEGFDAHFSSDHFSPLGCWTTPLYVHTLTGAHRERSAYPGPNMALDEWRAVYDQIQTVQTA